MPKIPGWFRHSLRHSSRTTFISLKPSIWMYFASSIPGSMTLVINGLTLSFPNTVFQSVLKTSLSFVFSKSCRKHNEECPLKGPKERKKETIQNFGSEGKIQKLKNKIQNWTISPGKIMQEGSPTANACQQGRTCGHRTHEGTRGRRAGEWSPWCDTRLCSHSEGLESPEPTDLTTSVPKVFV